MPLQPNAFSNTQHQFFEVICLLFQLHAVSNTMLSAVSRELLAFNTQQLQGEKL